MKSTKLAAIISFIIGIGVGAAGSWYFLKTVYEQRTQEEIESIKQAYADKYDKNSIVKTDAFDEKDDAEKQLDIKEYSHIIKAEGYHKTDYNAISKAVDEGKESEIELTKEPVIKSGEESYVIAPEEFGEYEDYCKISLTHYSDGVLADIHDNVIDDVDEIVGSNYADHFGEYEDDSVYIRNDAKKCDYEILADERTWADILESKPYLKEN